MSFPIFPYRDMNVHASPTQYTFVSPSSPTSPALVVDRPSGDMRLVTNPILSGKRVTSSAGILGMIKLSLDKYIIIITRSMLVGRIQGHSIYKVQATEFLPLQEKALHDEEEDAYLRLLNTHIRTGPMYFAYTFDLTQAFQRQPSLNKTLPLWQRADDRFFWNRYIQSDLIDLRSTHNGADPFILPVIFGFVKIVQTRIKNTPFKYILITRKSRHRAGTRYFTRGVDENGNVANFNETEQAVILGDSDTSPAPGGEKPELQVLSHVQTRGSVPVFWAEINHLSYVPKLQIRGVDAAIGAARKHFDEQIRTYGDNYLVNLVNQKGREERVKRAYETMVRNLVSSAHEEVEASEVSSERFHEIEPSEKRRKEDRLHYVYFDFHHECRSMRWHRAELLLDQLKDGMEKQRYFHGVFKEGGNVAILSQQTSVVRTNCMDCLDRTNVVQSMLARYALTRQLQDIGVLTAAEATKQFAHFELMFRAAWADNADVVSRAYSGTGALKTDFTRTGVRTKRGALADFSNSVTRYFRNNFADGPRQDAYDLFLGNFMPISLNSLSLLVDRRPVIVQSVPYIFLGMVMFLFMAIVAPRTEESSQIMLRIFMLVAFVIAAWCVYFIKQHGMLYVNWPKLNTPAFAAEGINEAMSKIKKDPVIGQWVKGHERGVSTNSIRLIHLEEGKKRIE